LHSSQVAWLAGDGSRGHKKAQKAQMSYTLRFCHDAIQLTTTT
jgi:hypothetical protein